VKRGECRRREYGGERAGGGAEVMEINGNKREVIVSLTTLLTLRHVVAPSSVVLVFWPILRTYYDNDLEQRRDLAYL
jgi:hypothetical protein